MRERFIDVVAELLDDDPRVAVVVADISASRLEAIGAERPERVVNVGIREALMIGIAGGMALEGLRPVAHSYASFLVDRAFEQIKLDLVHQAAGGAILVSIGGSYDAAEEGRTHQSPGDVALLGTLPGVTIHVPGHADEVDRMLREEVARDGTAYIRLSEEANDAARPPFEVRALAAPGRAARGGGGADARSGARGRRRHRLRRRVRRRRPPVPDARAGEPRRPATSCWWSRTWPVPAPARSRSSGLRRLHCLGVRDPELRRYGTGPDHRRAHGLDAAGIARSTPSSPATRAPPEPRAAVGGGQLTLAASVNWPNARTSPAGPISREIASPATQAVQMHGRPHRQGGRAAPPAARLLRDDSIRESAS